MTAHDNLGRQFDGYVRLFRGLEAVDPGSVHHDQVGIHWTENPSSATRFATGVDKWWDSSASEDDEPVKGTILEGYVHPRNIVPRDSEEFDDLAEWTGILGANSEEEETTVRPGAPVHITALHHVNEDGSVAKTIKLRKPKKGKA